MSNHLVLTEYRNNIAIITLNSLETLNTLTPEFHGEIVKAILEIEKNPDIRVVIVTGTGNSFMVGFDIKRMKDLSPDEAIALTKSLNVHDIIHGSKKIYIAAINGFALGAGCELSLVFDFRVASEDAKFGFPETGLGILPGGGGTQRLPRLIGVAMAKELILLNKIISADEALQIGLVNKVVPPNQLIPSCITMANNITKSAAAATGYAKEAINLTLDTDLQTGLAIERTLWGLCFATGEHKEGMSAFLEKRSPDFSSFKSDQSEG